MTENNFSNNEEKIINILGLMKELIDEDFWNEKT